MSKLRIDQVLMIASSGLLVACGSSDDSEPTNPELCGVGQTQCGDLCVSLTDNALHCGACFVQCASGAVCTQGACVCLSGLTSCGAECVDLASNGDHCGGCGAACEGGLVCSQGACRASCAMGETQCGTSCVNTTSNAAHCGGCDIACTTGQSCVEGACVCPTGQALCEGFCTDTTTDPSNCGSCGASCDAGVSCVNGVCQGGTGGGSSGGSGGASGGASGGTGGAGGASGGTGGASGGTTTGGGGNTGGTMGECDPGTTSTTWASSCSTSAGSCTSGTWIEGGPDPDHTHFSKCSESEHFVVYSDEACTSSAQSAVSHLETVWDTYFGSPMYMREPFCSSSTKYKAAVHVHSDWGLTGGAWDSQHMGMWIGTGGLADHWGLAHEFMHGVQSVQGGQSCYQSNTCGWVYESHANWATQQQTEYHTSELHCAEMMYNMPHLYLGSTRDRYCNWQFMEFLKDKYCHAAVNAIWTGSPAADPFTAVRNGMGWSVSQLNDFMGEWAMHNVTWDYQDPQPQGTQNQGSLYRSVWGNITDTSQTIRLRRLTKVESLDDNFATNHRFISPFHWAPQRYGYNIIRLYPDAGTSEVTVTFRGVTAAPSSPDWRWGLVATDSGFSSPRYSALQAGSDGALTFCVDSNEALFLIVTATPSSWYDIVWDQPYNTVPRYPYMFQVDGAWPDGFRDGTRDDCPSGLARATNGGGCAPAGTTAYVGPYATVMSGASVTGSARIEDHAIVANGTVSGGTVGALTIIGTSGGWGANSFNVSSGTAMATFYPLGFFASGQSLSGGTLVGDVELQGSGVSRSSGTCSGFVDGSTCDGPGTDSTPEPPYTWR